MMSYQDQTRAFYTMQNELIEMKVETSVGRYMLQVNNSFAQLAEQMNSFKQEILHEISDLRREMHQEIGALRKEMYQEIGEIKQRLSAVETALGMRNQTRAEVRTRFLDYSFKAGWVLLTTLPGTAALIMHFT